MAPLFKVAVFLNLSLYAAAQGTQFITGPCTSDADCASQCCGFNSGKCAAVIPAQERDGGCGFGDASPNAGPNASASPAAGSENAAPAAPATSGAAAPAGTSAASAGSGKPLGTQFITGACASDAECASSCCGFNSGKCAAVIPAQERDGGCGFGDAQPNSGPGAAAGATASDGGAAQAQSTENQASAASAAAAAASPAAASAAIAPGTQFITGACTSDADCASACCGFNSGKCAGPVVAQERDGGCGFGDAQPNDNAAKALQGRSLGRFGASFM